MKTRRIMPKTSAILGDPDDPAKLALSLPVSNLSRDCQLDVRHLWYYGYPGEAVRNLSARLMLSISQWRGGRRFLGAILHFVGTQRRSHA